MDVNEIIQMTTTAQERISREQFEADAHQQQLELARNKELADEITAVRARVDAEIIKAAQQGKSQAKYEYTVRISASRNSAETIDEIKSLASEVMTGVIHSLSAEGFSQHRLESRDELAIQDNVDAAPEYFVIPLRVSWPSSVDK
jgi:hypothetical protein